VPFFSEPTAERYFPGHNYSYMLQVQESGPFIDDLLTVYVSKISFKDNNNKNKLIIITVATNSAIHFLDLQLP
jgi:hypothetical protein